MNSSVAHNSSFKWIGVHSVWWRHRRSGWFSRRSSDVSDPPAADAPRRRRFFTTDKWVHYFQYEFLKYLNEREILCFSAMYAKKLTLVWFNYHLTVLAVNPGENVPTTLTQLARSNPFQAPLFSVKPDQQQESLQVKRKLAAAAYDGKKFFFISWIGNLYKLK